MFAFARTAGGRQLVVAVPRLIATIAPQADMAPIGERVWGDTHIVVPFSPGQGRLHNVITDRCVTVQPDTGAIRAADAFDRFPIAVLIGG